MKILTERGFNNFFSRQTVYEWEDDMAEELGIELEYLSSYQKHLFARLMRKLRIRRPISWKNGKEIHLFMAMNIDLLRLMAWYVGNIIPVVLDVTMEEIDELYQITRELPVFWVTSMCLYKEMKRRYPDCRVRFIPQTVSRRYERRSVDKDITFIQYGRTNPVLHQFALQYCDENRTASYLYRCADISKGYILYKDGIKHELGMFNTREEFISYLLRSKVSLCSTPYMEKTRDFGQNIDFFTARWYECVACKCSILARWSEFVDEEIRITRMNQVAVNIESYPEFKEHADAFLAHGQNDKIVSAFLDKNCAQARAREIMSCLNDCGL